MTVLMLDVDHFKNVNDTWGHDAGDLVLRELASLLRAHFRGDDIACRYGGEEFVLVMPDTGPEDAAALCDRLRAGIEAVTWPRHPERRVTVSVGVAGSHAAPEVTVEAFIEQADANLYTAKRVGRNRVVTSNVNRAGRPGMRLAG